MDGIGRIFAATVRASGTIPQISVVLGPVAGAAAYGPALTDVVIMAPAGRLSVTRRDAARGVTGGQIGMEGSGEPETHDREPGVAHIVAGSREDACVRARRVASLLAVPGKADPDAAAPAEDLRALLPASPRRPYDVRPLVTGLLDHDDDGFSFEEFQATWAPNVVIGLGRLGGQTVGVVANNLAHKGGRLDLPSAEKAARFVRLCDCMGVPLLSLIDASGHLPGLGREWSDVVRHGAKLLYAFVEASVPRVSVVTRQPNGSAYIALNSRSLGATTVFAWPDTESARPDTESARPGAGMAVTGAEPAAPALALRRHALGAIDEVIDPSQTRGAVAAVFAAAPFRRGAHGNIPL
ncbi:carboxyl transferase domain-containing protein [Actinomadura madurae]|nr:acyl-CoA carboxylase subunit beta [Actinomadura madurae]